VAKSKPYTQYYLHRRDATRAGFGFELTYAEWQHIWDESGQFYNRGNKHDQYRMERIDQTAPFAVNNVKIIKRKVPDIFHRRYATHRSNAGKREIPFLFTFDEWIKIWLDSGHWYERGTTIGKYCMARFGDKGPYAADNVEIIKHQDNTKQATGWKHTPETKEFMKEHALRVYHKRKRDAQGKFI